MAERKGKLVIVTGVPGVGKTTVLTAALEACSKRGVDVKLVNYGDVMFEMASSKGIAADRDAMRRLPVDAQMKLQLDAAKKISSTAKYANVILDTHMFIMTLDGYMPGIPSWVAESLHPDSLVLLEAAPEEISKRRAKDSQIRNREADSSMKVAEHQNMGRGGAATLSILTGCTVVLAENKEGGHKAAAEVIATLFRSGD
jgi:adenylate kinase